MREVIITIGVPGSGKSTWAKELIAKDTSYARVNRDSIREMMGDKSQWQTESFEALVSKIQKRILFGYLANKRNVVIDDCNVSKKTYNELREWVQEYVDGNGIPIAFKSKVFKTSYDVCVERDANRDRTVGVGVIDKMHRRFSNGVRDGWIKDSIDVLVREVRPEPDMSKPLAIMCDLDGTAAIIEHRDPYDTEKCEDDIVEPIVANMLSVYHSLGYKVIIVTGRSDKYRAHCERWLASNNIPYDHMFMRIDGDMQKDSKLKSGIYERDVEPFYSVEFVLDDRNQVVEMWRKRGVKCLQVAFGDF